MGDVIQGSPTWGGSSANSVHAASSSTVAFGGGPPNDGDMEPRIIKLEEAIKTLATRADVEKGFGDLRADLHKMDASIVRWMIATIIALIFGFSAMTWTMGSNINTTTNSLINEVRLSRSASSPPAPQQPMVVVVPQTAQPVPPEAPRAE